METQSNPEAPEQPAAHPRHLCEEITGEVRDMAIALFVGRLTPSLFERAVVTLEAAKVKRFGFRLTAERLDCGGSRFHLVEAGTGRDCATFDFTSAAEGLQVKHLCG